MKKSLIFLALSILVVALGVFLFTATPTNAPSPEPAIGLANPASVLCQKAGGTLEAVTTPAGESANCIFPSGERCDEWAFYRGECPVEGVSKTANYENGTTSVTVVYRMFDDTAIISVSEGIRSVLLNLVRSGSGARYLSSDGTLEFWEHQGEGTLSVEGEIYSVVKLVDGSAFTPTEIYKRTDASGQTMIFEQQDYTKYRLTIDGKVTVGDLNTERGWKDDIDATVFVLNWKESEEKQLVFVRKTGVAGAVSQLDAKREELVPSVILKLSYP
jgi:uncharacterized protein